MHLLKLSVVHRDSLQNLFVSRFALNSLLEGFPLAKNSTQSVKQRDFVDYLCEQQRVSKGAWAYWLRKNEAAPQTFGYLLGNIHQRIKNRPDILESILFDGLGQKLRGKQLVGFTITEIKSRIPA